MDDYGSENNIEKKSISNMYNQSYHKGLNVLTDEQNTKNFALEEPDIEEDKIGKNLQNISELNHEGHPVPSFSLASAETPAYFLNKDDHSDSEYPWAPGPPSTWQKQGNIVI